VELLAKRKGVRLDEELRLPVIQEQTWARPVFRIALAFSADLQRKVEVVKHQLV
jgi:hypothetical protein